MNNKQRLFEIMGKLDKSFKPNSNKIIDERKKTEINPKYTHFAVLKSNNKIVNGWDYSGYDQNELGQFKKDYFLNDISDMDIDTKLVSIYGKNFLINKGINPLDNNNWFKFEADGWRDKNELNEEDTDQRENLEYFLSFNNDDVYWKWINGEIDDNDAIQIMSDVDGISYDSNINYKEKYS